MDALSDPMCSEVVVMKSAQVGATEILNNLVGYYAHWEPSSILVLQPNQKPMAEAWSKDRLAPMIRDTPELQAIVADAKGRDSNNTVLHKTWPGGHVSVAGANSPAGLASRPIRVVLCDEVDRYPTSAGVEGDPVSLARKRTTTFWNRKVALFSTPTVKGASRIESAFENSTQEYYQVPCPHCEHKQAMVWEQVTYTGDDPSTAGYTCSSCAALWSDAERWAALRWGSWVAEKPGRRVRGFHISELYSPWVALHEIVADYLEKKDLPESYKTWVNTSLGLPYAEEGEQEADSEALHARREQYDDAPEDVEAVTVGADVQGDRIEAEKVGWNRSLESWSLDYQVFHGDPRIPAEQPGSPWADFHEFITQPVMRADGIELRTWATCVDANYLSDEVYKFCKRRKRLRVYAVRGKSGMGEPAVIRKGKTHNRKDFRADSTDIYTLGVDGLKSRVFSRLALATPGPGYCHFPDHYDLGYFDQLTAERAVRAKRPNGRVVIEWQKLQDRNEALDCRVYSMGALEIRRPRWGASVKNADSEKPTDLGDVTSTAIDTTAPTQQATTKPAKGALRIGQKRQGLRIGR